MVKQETRDKADGHESVQGEESNSSRAPTISLILGIVSLGILGLNVPILIAFGPLVVFFALFISGPVGTVMGVVGLVFGIKGVQSTHAKRGRAIDGIFLCGISLIMGIGSFAVGLYFLRGGGL